MPFLHDFYCPFCDHAFEELVDGDAIPACPLCRSTGVQRALSAPHLKTGAPPFKIGPALPRAPSAPAPGGCGGNCPGGCGQQTPAPKP